MANEKRLIDTNALKNALSKLEASGGHKYYRKGMDDTLHFHMPNILDDQPTVDAVEVVRCKDCVYNENGCCTHSEYYDDTRYRPDYFCADGERKDNG